MTVHRPGGTSLGWREAAAFWLARSASAWGSICSRSGALALAQPEESCSRMVIGKFGAALAIAGEESFGIGHRGNGSARGKNTGGGLLILLREFGDFRDAAARSCGVAPAVAGK